MRISIHSSYKTKISMSQRGNMQKIHIPNKKAVIAFFATTESDCLFAFRPHERPPKSQAFESVIKCDKLKLQSTCK